MIAEKINTYFAKKQTRARNADADYATAKLDIENTRPIDALTTDATEVLGENNGVIRGHYSRVADRITEKIETAEGKKDIPGMREKYLKFRDDQTTDKIKRIQAKINNSSDSFLSKQINRQRNQKIAALNRKKKVFAHQSGTLEKNRKQKPEHLQKKIDQYVQKRVDAMYRKAQRAEMRKQGIGKHNFVKRAEFLAKITPEERKKITREAILLARRSNIQHGRLDADYKVDETLDTRKVDTYERTVE